MIGSIYKKTLNILAKVPVKLWGLSLLASLLSIIVTLFGILPIITIPVNAVISAGTAYMFLTAYRGQDVDSKHLFAGFKNFKHVAGGMCWMYLWIFLWFLIPIAGIVLGVIKALSYAYTPYILMEDKDISAFDALKKSMEKTRGIKGQLFGALFIVPIAYMIVAFVLSILSMIPIVGYIFASLYGLVAIVYSLLAPLFLGLVAAGFYNDAKAMPSFAYKAPTTPYQPPVQPPQPPVHPPVQNPVQPPQPPVQNPDPVCKVCGTANYEGAKFCKKCGSKLD